MNATQQLKLVFFRTENIVGREKCWLSAFSLNPFPNKPWFLHVCSTSLLKTLWEKEKLLVRSNFSFSHSVFYPFGELSSNTIKFKIIVCKLFQFGSLQNIVVWERVRTVFSKGLFSKVIKIHCRFIK